MSDSEKREFAYEVLSQVSLQVAQQTSTSAVMAALLGTMAMWLRHAHHHGVPADVMRRDVESMLDYALEASADEETVQ